MCIQFWILKQKKQQTLKLFFVWNKCTLIKYIYYAVYIEYNTHTQVHGYDHKIRRNQTTTGVFINN